MIRALMRFLRSIGYLLSGKVDDQTAHLQRDPTVVRATYEKIIAEKKSRAQEYIGAISQLIAQQETKVLSVKRLTEEITRLRKLQSGAGAKARERAADLKAQGLDAEAIKKDSIVLECQASFNDFSSTLKEKEDRVAELEDDVAEYGERIGKHKIQLQSWQRDIQKIKDEQADAVADFIMSAEEKAVNNVLAGVSEDGTEEELERMRAARQQAKAEAKVVSELAGTDSKFLEAEYERFASTTQANAEFDALLGLNETTDEKIARLESKLGKTAEKATT